MIHFWTFDERPDLVQRYFAEAENFWPPHMGFVHHDPVCEAFWPRLTTEFPSFQFFVHDEAQDLFLARGNTIPFSWSGRDDDLPDGVPAVLEQGFRQREDGVPVTSLCALLAGVQPNVRAKGLSAELLKYIRRSLVAMGCHRSLRPCVPTSRSAIRLPRSNGMSSGGGTMG